MFSSLINMSERIRLIVLGAAAAIILTIINIEIAGKESIVRNGAAVLLRIAPRDPRSLMQGDYMALRYTLANEIAREAEQLDKNDGVAIIAIGALDEASFVVLYDGQALQQGQRLLRYRKRGDTVRLASDAYFFEEGSGQDFNGARFGELRVNDKGDAVLISLRDAEGKRLGPQAR